MKNLKSINESLNAKSISEQDFLNLLENNCQKFINYNKYFEDNLIFRKQEDFGDFVYCEPSTSTADRIAPYARYNFHNLLVSNLDSWKDWPRRNKSLICASAYRALSHGASFVKGESVNYLIIPFDKTQIASGDRGDFWNCFSNIPNEPDFCENEDDNRASIAYYMNWLIFELGCKDEKERMILSTNWQSFKSFLEGVEVNDYIINKYFTTGNEVMWDDNLNLLQNLNILLNPKSNNFKLLDITGTMDYYTKFNPEESEACESWFEGPCLMIRYDKSNDFLNKLESDKIK